MNWIAAIKLALKLAKSKTGEKWRRWAAQRAANELKRREYENQIKEVEQRIAAIESRVDGAPERVPVDADLAAEVACGNLQCGTQGQPCRCGRKPTTRIDLTGRVKP